MFVLEPHDTAWDESAAHCQVITSATHRGQKWSVGVESPEEAGGRFLFRREGEWPLLVAIHKTSALSGPTELSLHRARDPFPLRMAFADCWNNHKWGRTLFLNENAQLRKESEAARFQVILSPDGCASWRVLRKTEFPVVEIENIHSHAEFFWSNRNSKEILLGDASIIGAILKMQWDDPNSDLSFGRRFVFMSEKQCRDEIWLWRRGDFDEMTRVLRWAFLSQHGLCDTLDEASWTINLWYQTQHKNVGGVVYRPTTTIISHTPPQLMEALHLALEWFAPTPQVELIERHLCLKHYSSRGWRYIEIQACQPTAHERLEAALAWRNWLETTRADEGAPEAD